MCTAVNYTNGCHLFGRNLDLEINYPVDVVITPHNYVFKMKDGSEIKNHHALIGMGLIQNDYPLYFEAINDAGLGMAGTAFAGLAYYAPVQEGKKNIAPFEFIPYILGQASTVEEARKLLENVNLCDVHFSAEQPNSPLHFLIGDKNESIVVEQTKEKGFRVYDDPYDVLTNCPDFDWQCKNISIYSQLTGQIITPRFAKDAKDIDLYSRGMGSTGLPGGVDSVSRFVRAAFTRLNSFCDPNSIEKNVGEYFHILTNVQQVNGEAEIHPGEYEITQYTSVGDTDSGIFYYTTYYNQNINAVDMKKENLEGSSLISYPVLRDLNVNIQN
ncbi:choloylglycine hydrolase [Dubosiella newyorkensis]|jgi:choloylglycine hydrolase|uniref:choloylglycine hydrolase n=9 Tax=Dubosiella newyorkensis TaxID=1862672 RepID=A0A1U7NP31_9FIRM|nr:choloylglycine hydrolase [Dubosiella newyorkensis]MCI9041128.1 choloylglycine hydrolase family protein [Dubosiella newyorkensis]OLU47243.1 hypothetical protein BO225_03335 [Dubosiella newyorkensis]